MSTVVPSLSGQQVLRKIISIVVPRLNVSECKSFSITLKRAPIVTAYGTLNGRRNFGASVDSTRPWSDSFYQKLTFEKKRTLPLLLLEAAERWIYVLIRSLQAGRGGMV